MSTIRNFRLFISASCAVAIGLVFAAVSYAQLPTSSPTSGQGVVPYRLSASNPGDDFPSNTDTNTCQRLAALASDNEIPGWSEVVLANAVGLKVDSSNGGTFGPVTTSTNGTYLNWSIASGYRMLGVVMKGGTHANFYSYADSLLTSDTGLASPPNASGDPAGISHYNICYVPDGGQPNTFNISGMKFFDINADGIMNVGDFPLGGFIIKTTFLPELTSEANEVTRVTQAGTGAWSINGIPEGTDYLVREVVPTDACDINNQPLPNFSWVQTAPAAIATVEPFLNPTPRRVYQGDLFANVTNLDFGNRCQGQGSGGLTIGFWSNRNGRTVFTNINGLGTLNPLYLRNESGVDQNFANHDEFRTWLLSANATNMAYMLSAQFAATRLNVLAGYIQGGTLLEVNGEVGTLNAWFAEANLSLQNNPITFSGHPERTRQEQLKNIFDSVNNNNFLVINTNCQVCTAQ